MTLQSELAALLSSASSKPSSVGTPGAAVALALHCIMIREGFSVEEPDADAAARRTRYSSYAPPSNWQVDGPNEWNFVYSHPGRMNRFKLIVSLHEKSGRTFVHASEEANPNNIQILGLQLEKYVPDAAALKKHDWEAVLTNEDTLDGFFMQHIVTPLLDNSVEEPPLAATIVRSEGMLKGSEAGAERRLYRTSSFGNLDWVASLPMGYAVVGASVGVMGLMAASAGLVMLLRAK